MTAYTIEINELQRKVLTAALVAYNKGKVIDPKYDDTPEDEALVLQQLFMGEVFPSPMINGFCF